MTITIEQRERIIFLTGCGNTANEIAQDVGVHKRTVLRWQKRFRQTGGLSQNKIPGRPRSTSAEQDAQIANAAAGNSQLGALFVHRQLHTEIPASRRTYNRRLREA